MSNKVYRVGVTGNFVAEKRIRAGVVVPADGGYVGELTKEQLEAIESDPFLTVSEGSAESGTDEAADIVEAARKEAEEIVAEATELAKTATDAANGKAEELLSQATKNADVILANAKAEAERIVAEAKKSVESKVEDPKTDGNDSEPTKSTKSK
ncbi:hypothetical protein [Antrihabitans sp. YC2-6]|uniref:hypothetical protein n=1 Tax=Antrihabitans sp. YC2-6 TaxID=2799498 RepID=UPI0018F436F4|nr:hypothetical protein [Antrihabitans sp. YC2-6]MBJ8343946.1 hypothetical protein [Antrihabitans sp. YC2-6]